MFFGFGEKHTFLLSLKKLLLILWVLLHYIFILAVNMALTYIFYSIVAFFYPKLRKVCRVRTIAFFIGFFVLATYSGLWHYINLKTFSSLVNHGVRIRSHLGYNSFLGILAFLVFFCFYQKKEDNNYLIALSFLFITAFTIGLLATTGNTNILLHLFSKNISLPTYLYYSHLCKYSFAFIAVSFICIANFRWYGIDKYFLEPLMWLLLIITAFLGIYIRSFYNYRSPSAFLNNTRMHVIPFDGLYASKSRANLMLQVMDVYQKNNCQTKLFLAYPDQPLLFYVFRRFSILGNETWISAVREFKQNVIIDQFKKSPGWCIFVAPGFNYQSKTFFNRVNTYLQNNSRKKMVIKPIKKPPYPDFYPSKYEIFIR
jgi:hypothetical protein